MTWRKTARIAARLRSVVHDSQASRTRWADGMSPSVVAEPGQPVAFPPRGADLVLGTLADIEPVGPVNNPFGIVTARLIPPFLSGPDLLEQFRAPRCVVVLPVA